MIQGKQKFHRDGEVEPVASTKDDNPPCAWRIDNPEPGVDSIVVLMEPPPKLRAALVECGIEIVALCECRKSTQAGGRKKLVRNPGVTAIVREKAKLAQAMLSGLDHLTDEQQYRCSVENIGRLIAEIVGDMDKNN